MRGAAFLVLALALAGCGAANGSNSLAPSTNSNSGNAPGGNVAQRPARDRLDVYMEATGAEARERSHVGAFEVPGFAGIACLSIPSNHGENRERWFHGAELVPEADIARVALGTRGWQTATPALRCTLAREWVEATTAPLLTGAPPEVDALQGRDSPFQPPSASAEQDGGVAVIGWQKRVVSFGVAGGQVYYQEGHWHFSPDGACRVSYGKQYTR